MNRFLQDAVSTVLTSTLNELIILNHGKHLQSSSIQKRAAEKKFQAGGKNILPVATLNKIKLNNDLKKLIDTYLETIAELQANGTIYTLLTTIDQQTEKDKKYESLIDGYNAIISDLKSLKSRIVDFKTEAENKLLQASDTLCNLKSKWRIISKINELEINLVKKWEYTRFTQATILCEKDEQILESKLAELVTKTETEERVILDFQAYSKRQFAEYSETIDMWKERYSKELDELLSSISEKENKIKEVNNTYEKHNEIYCSRQRFIDEYMEQTAEQNRKIQLQKRRIESAISIQAWWRGVMVRKCLGPYRKKAKKGKKPKKSK